MRPLPQRAEREEELLAQALVQEEAEDEEELLEELLVRLHWAVHVGSDCVS
jgi:hypothetical protein